MILSERLMLEIWYRLRYLKVLLIVKHTLIFFYSFKIYFVNVPHYSNASQHEETNVRECLEALKQCRISTCNWYSAKCFWSIVYSSLPKLPSRSNLNFMNILFQLQAVYYYCQGYSYKGWEKKRWVRSLWVKNREHRKFFLLLLFNFPLSLQVWMRTFYTAKYSLPWLIWFA